MFQGPKAEICEVHLQYGNSTTKWPFYTFFSSKFPSNIYSILFECNALLGKKHNDIFLIVTWTLYK